jgi:GntR family transcriptional regulator, transcriptional repressor for pyruvate dehydrogenase complex
MAAKNVVQRLPREVVRALSKQIESGELEPGARLPSERQLCETFSVSRPVVREAFSHLKSEGLIVSHPGRGAFVAGPGEQTSFRLREISIREKKSLGQILELLVGIEVAATRLAAIRRTPDDLKRIRRALLGMEYAIASDRLGAEEDFAFHCAIVDATHNRHYQALNGYLDHSVRSLIRQARQNTRNKHADLIQAVQREHQAIFRALEAGNPTRAARAAERHLRNAAARLNIYASK